MHGVGARENVVPLVVEVLKVERNQRRVALGRRVDRIVPAEQLPGVPDVSVHAHSVERNVVPVPYEPFRTRRHLEPADHRPPVLLGPRGVSVVRYVLEDEPVRNVGDGTDPPLFRIPL